MRPFNQWNYTSKLTYESAPLIIQIPIQFCEGAGENEKNHKYKNAVQPKARDYKIKRGYSYFLFKSFENLESFIHVSHWWKSWNAYGISW